MKPKLRYANRKINPYGGLNFIHPFFKSKGIERLITKSLGKRVKQAKYSISDVIIGHTLSIMAGAKRIEHQQSLRPYLNNIENVKVPSSDTTSRIFRRLSSKNISRIAEKSSHVHYFNSNPKLNDLLIKMGLQLGLIRKFSKINILDYDNSIIETLKYDATKTYKKKDKVHSMYGYQPAFATLNGIPVYVEGRTGHSNATTSIGDTFMRMMKLLDKNGIKVSLFRSDNAAYNKPLIKYCEKNKIRFILRFPRTPEQVNESKWRKKWESHVDRDGIKFDLASTTYVVKHGGKNRTHTTHRLVVKRVADFKGKIYYSFLITNDRVLSNKKVHDLYAARGTQEKQFAELKNDWNLKRPPFSLLEQNTVFWIASLMGYTFYKFILKKVSNIYCEIKPTYWLRKFREKFINTVVELSEDGFLDIVDDAIRLFSVFRRLMDEW